MTYKINSSRNLSSHKTARQYRIAKNKSGVAYKVISSPDAIKDETMVLTTNTFSSFTNPSGISLNGNSISSNLAPQLEEEPLREIIIKTPKPSANTTKVRRSTSMYTSTGRPKAKAADPITSQQDILRMKEYFLTSGHPLYRTRNHLIFVLGVSTALRVSDLINLKMGDVFNPDHSIKQYITIIETKTRKTNHIMLNAEVQSALKLYRDDFLAHSKNVAVFNTPQGEVKRLIPDSYLFQSKITNGKLTDKALYCLVNEAGKALNLPYHLGSHSLRKTFGYWTLKLKPNDTNALTVLQQALNHSSLDSTMHYVGLTQENKDEVYNTMGSLFTCPKSDDVNVNATDNSSNGDKESTVDNSVKEVATFETSDDISGQNILTDNINLDKLSSSEKEMFKALLSKLITSDEG